MGRIPMVTRTIESTVATIFAVNTEDRSTFEQSIKLAGTYKDNDKLMKAIEKVFSGEPVKPVSIISSEVVSNLYGMTEQEFIRLAKPLPPRGTKEEPVSATE